MKIKLNDYEEYSVKWIIIVSLICVVVGIFVAVADWSCQPVKNAYFEIDKRTGDTLKIYTK